MSPKENTNNYTEELNPQPLTVWKNDSLLRTEPSLCCDRVATVYGLGQAGFSECIFLRTEPMYTESWFSGIGFNGLCWHAIRLQ